MSEFYKEWQLISKKVMTLQNISNYLFNSFQSMESGANAPMREIHTNCKDIFRIISKFKENYGSLLPDETLNCLNDFLNDLRLNDLLKDTQSRNDLLKQHTIELLIKLFLLESNISYNLSDTQIRIRKTVEVAFSHLQRLIIVDDSVRANWKKEIKETRFEELGSAHLLAHKIWAFKTNAKGERTDLIFSEIDMTVPLYQSVDGLVLTEWKVVENQKNLQKQIEQAKRQADRYKRGSLAALELSKYCYLVMVSQHHLNVENHTFSEDDVIYRVINIAYSPKSPSKS